MVGAAIIYANYFHAIDIYEGARGVRTLTTASLFATYAVSSLNILICVRKIYSVQLDYMTNVSCFFSEFLGTAILMIVILAAIDKRNNPPPKGLLPLVLFFAFVGIGAALGMETGVSFVFLPLDPPN